MGAIFSNLPPITLTFIIVIALLTLVFHAKYSDKASEYGPTILTTVGIFATFLGIAMGLAKFDSTNVGDSVPELLQGLKTAFFGSVFGVGGALTLKFRHYFAPEKREFEGSGVDGDITAGDLLKVLNHIRNALVGGEEGTLISQLKLSRSDSNERLDALKKAQLEALQKLSEMGSKQLVEALKDVIRDFNAKITEQFGENFKQLNDAVGKLLVWQEQYKAHVDQSIKIQTETVASMKTASENYADMVGKSSIFSKTAQDLSALLASLETQKQQLVGALKSLADLLKTASGSLPQIETKVMELTNQLSNSVVQNQQVLGRALTETTNQTRTAIQDNQQTLNKALADNTLLIKNSIQTVNQELAKVNQEFNKHIGDLANKTKEQVSVLDAALTEELQKSLTSLGKQLTALSEKFVSDYMPLTERLRQVVQMARQ